MAYPSANADHDVMNNGGPNPHAGRHHSRSANSHKNLANAGPLVGTETIISRHYQEAAIAAAVGKDWPNSMKADIEASCEPVRRGSGDEGRISIAMNRIMVTHERKMVFSSEEMEDDGRSEMTGGTAGAERQREGSTDGIVDREGQGHHR
ncbi:hypothetical protein SLS55_009701 [Diplodia seriata]|uniref:Uncharacterized protein n=1 Tax=Diplodia seriata TaxID=420778 RepID=A0ABR3C5V9_9PEZI